MLHGVRWLRGCSTLQHTSALLTSEAVRVVASDDSSATILLKLIFFIDFVSNFTILLLVVIVFERALILSSALVHRTVVTLCVRLLDHAHLPLHLPEVLFAQVDRVWLGIRAVVQIELYVGAGVDLDLGHLVTVAELLTQVHLAEVDAGADMIASKEDALAHLDLALGFAHISLRQPQPALLEDAGCLTLRETLVLLEVIRCKCSFDSPSLAFFELESIGRADRNVPLDELDVLRRRVQLNVLDQVWLRWVIGVARPPSSSLVKSPDSSEFERCELAFKLVLDEELGLRPAHVPLPGRREAPKQVRI